MNNNNEKFEASLEFHISKAKVLLLLIPVVLLALGSIYVVLFSRQVSVKIYMVLLTVIVGAVLIKIYKKLKKDTDAPVFTFDSNGIYHKGWDKEFISWDNVRLIWSRPYCYPRRLCIETIDQSPDEFPRSVLFPWVTPGFNDAWRFITVHHPEKLEGKSRFS
jgi:Ca2+/Na+ antiporter